MRPNFPTATASRTTSTVATDGAGHRMTVVVVVVVTAWRLFHVPFIVVGPGDFFRERMFSQHTRLSIAMNVS